LPKKERLQPLQVYQLLPRTNCKLCNYNGCMGFAFALLSREKIPADCPELQKEEFRDSLKVLNAAFGKPVKVEKTGLLLEKEICNGCGDCVIACTKILPRVFHHGTVFSRQNVRDIPPVFQVINGVVEIINWPSCKRVRERLPCRVCEDKCPFGAIALVREGELGVP